MYRQLNEKKKRGMGMEFQHELIIPNEGLPFKLFLFEGRNGNYVRKTLAHVYRDFYGNGGESFFLY